MSQWKRGQIINSKREMIGYVGLEQKYLESEQKLLIQDMIDNRPSMIWCEEEVKVLKEEYFGKKDVSRLQKPQSPLGPVSISCDVI